MKMIITRPLSTATPESAMKPTPAEIEAVLTPQGIRSLVVVAIMVKGVPSSQASL